MMKNVTHNILFVLLLIPFLSFGQADYIENYIEYHNSLDLLYSNDKQLTCITANAPHPKGLDYITAHTTRIDEHGGAFGDIIDEGITLSKIYVDSGDGEIIQKIENIFIDISTPDEIAATLVDNNFETIHDLKVDPDGYLIGTGIYHELTTCTGPGGLGGLGGPSTNISVPWPFYFKYNVDVDTLVYFKRLRRPTGPCLDNPLDALPVDIEVLNANEYVICLSEGTDRGLLRIDANNGAILGAKQYRYGNQQIFDPVDVEVAANQIFAVGKMRRNFPAAYKPALLSTHHNLNSIRFRGFNVPASNSSSEYIKMSGVRYNPESNSLLLAGWVLKGMGEVLTIHIDNLITLHHDWIHLIDMNVPNAISTFGLTYGLEYLEGRNRFALHAYGNETYGLDAYVYNYLVEIGNDVNDPVLIKRLDYDFHGSDRNDYPVNNTLVQSPRTNYLGLVLHRDNNSDPFTPISFLKTDLDTPLGTEYTCLTPILADVESPYTTAFNLRHWGSTIVCSTEDKELVSLINVTPSRTIICEGTGGTEARTKKEEEVVTVVKNSNDFSIYPNPARDQIELNIVDHYQIFDITGKQVFEGKEVNQINVSYLLTGIYIIRNQSGQVKKLIIE